MQTNPSPQNIPPNSPPDTAATVATLLGLTPEAVLGEVMAMVFFDPADLARVESPEDIAALPLAARRAIIGWAWDSKGHFVLKLAPKTPLLTLLGHHLGLWRSSGEGGGVLSETLSEMERARRLSCLLTAVAADAALAPGEDADDAADGGEGDGE
ncbi:hypothetical protein [Novispirillum itersonii]|uniref:Uncharacterized protein n=1 Tax=Novispirillum itersonii TaxID=189 RepID=A0A7W9ZFD9_NOVIT|nr:hypothetical protein [Novispirillum itersonii]MBB6210230.1 hypothetical protein [Novispirillum itersonii]